MAGEKNMANRRKKSGFSVYQLKVTLLGLEPPVWRRIQIPANTDLGTLHYILQAVMGWTNSHLHQYVVGKQLYSALEFGLGEDSFGPGPKVGDEDSVGLYDALPKARARIIYEYDFGDSWEHKILVEKIFDPEKGATYPRCIEGARACPPEDCGGVWGYMEMLETLKNPNHPEHEEIKEWIGKNFDPEAFDIDAVNRALRRF